MPPIKNTSLIVRPRFPASVATLAAGLLLLTPGLHADEQAVKLHETFAKGIDRWTVTDDSAWELKECDEHGHVLCLIKKNSDYKPPHRSPLNIALLDDVMLGSFTMTLKVKSTEPYYNHRDLCLFFGHQGADKFHYVHLGEETDPHANQIFIVNEAPRVKISEETTDGTKWQEGQWHNIKLVRDIDTGRIEVYFDDMEVPIMVATDKTFTWGKVGVGSFDDRGCFADIRIEGTKAATAP